MGGFADAAVGIGGVPVPAGPQNADLNLVLVNLARTSSAQISQIEQLNAPISFNTGPAGGLGVTIFEAFVGGGWQDLDDICDETSGNYHLGIQLA